MRASRLPWSGALALILGLLLAQAVIYLSTGWRDGFGTSALWALKRHFLARLPLTLAYAAASGWLLETFQRRCLQKAAGLPLAGWPVPLALLRAFIHFPFYGFIVLIQFMGIFLGGLGQSLWGWLRKARKPSEPAMGFSDSTALWMMLGPLEGMKDDEGSRLSFNRITADLPIRALRLFPILLLALWIWTGAEGEDSGERVDPFWLSLAATWWLGDFFLVAWLHRPLWMRRG